jgi:HEAT repeat protein
MSPPDLSKLQAAIGSRDATALFHLVPQFKHCGDAVPTLAQLLLEEWHESHEDIVFTLGLIGDARAIESIAKAVTIPFESLVKWHNLPEFQRKCAYALARIGTAESRSVLEVLAAHPDPQLREYGEEGLQKWPLPYRAS